MADAILGHEIAGTVVAVGDRAGSGARGGPLSLGDRVVSLHWDQTEAWPTPLTATGPVSSFLGLTLPGGCTYPGVHPDSVSLCNTPHPPPSQEGRYDAARADLGQPRSPRVSLGVTLRLTTSVRPVFLPLFQMPSTALLPLAALCQSRGRGRDPPSRRPQ